jgi:hypothetical protein
MVGCSAGSKSNHGSAVVESFRGVLHELPLAALFRLPRRSVCCQLCRPLSCLSLVEKRTLACVADAHEIPEYKGVLVRLPPATGGIMLGAFVQVEYGVLTLLGRAAARNVATRLGAYRNGVGVSW